MVTVHREDWISSRASWVAHDEFSNPDGAQARFAVGKNGRLASGTIAVGVFIGFVALVLVSASTPVAQTVLFSQNTM